MRVKANLTQKPFEIQQYKLMCSIWLEKNRRADCANKSAFSYMHAIEKKFS